MKQWVGDSLYWLALITNCVYLFQFHDQWYQLDNLKSAMGDKPILQVSNHYLFSSTYEELIVKYLSSYHWHYANKFHICLIRKHIVLRRFSNFITTKNIHMYFFCSWQNFSIVNSVGERIKKVNIFKSMS